MHGETLHRSLESSVIIIKYPTRVRSIMTAGYWVNAPPYSSFARKPRQPRRYNTSRKTAGVMVPAPRAPNRLPPGIKVKMNYSGKRVVPRKPISAGTECYQMRLAKQTSTLTNNAASQAGGPKNSLLLQPAGFHGSTTITDGDGNPYSILGNFIKPVYGWITKVRVSFQNIASHADNKMGLVLRLHHGVVKVAMNKTAFSFSGHSAFASAASGEVLRQLYDSNITSDFLDYTKKNRDVKINGSFIVKPNRSNMIRTDYLAVTNTVPSTTDTIKSYNAPPPKEYVIHHPVPKMKTRIQKDGTAPHFPMPLHLWMPFTILTCDQLTGNSGHFDVEHSSRLYFTDN